LTSVSPHDVGIGVFVDRFEHTSERKRSFFLWLDGAFHRLKSAPTRLGVGRGFKTYRGLRPRLLKSDFSNIEHFTIQCLPPGCEEFRG